MKFEASFPYKAFYFLKNWIFPHKFKQELLFVHALKERGLKFNSNSIKVDHDLGFNYLGNRKFSIIYPDSYIKLTEKYFNLDKQFTFYFNGFISEEGGRYGLLKPFLNRDDAEIVNSDFGRKSDKTIFNHQYFRQLGLSFFGLCPHQLDWPGDKKNLWTYRFIECCLVGAIPVLFEETPLGSEFIKGFNVVWKKDCLIEDPIAEAYSQIKALQNRELALKRFFLDKSPLSH